MEAGHQASGKLPLNLSVCHTSVGIQDKIREVIPNGNNEIQDFEKLIKINRWCAQDM